MEFIGEGLGDVAGDLSCASSGEIKVSRHEEKPTPIDRFEITLLQGQENTSIKRHKCIDLGGRGARTIFKSEMLI